MKIAIVINTSWNIYNYRRGLIMALLEQGWEVIAIAPYDEFSRKLEQIGCTFVPIAIENKGMNPLKDLFLLFRFYFIYRKVKPDCILHYTIKPNVYGTLAAALLHIRCVSNVSGLGTAFIRQGFLLQVVKQLYHVAFRFPQRVFFQNKDDRDLFVALNILSKERTDLVAGSGIDLQEYTPAPMSEEKIFTFVLIARLLADKGIREYAEASKQLKAEGFFFVAQLIGFFDRESPYNISREELNNWQESGSVVFLGASDDIQKEIAKAHCVVLPSYREGIPRSLLEGMALSRPIITTNVPGCREVIMDGINGYICEAVDSQSLAMAMKKMLESPQSKLEEMGKQGRMMVEQTFDEKLVINKYFQEILKR